MSDESKRKERVLHARVSESLDEELKKRANQLGVTVSNLVRNVLLNAFELVEDVVADSGTVARAARGKRRSESPEPIGWQELVMAKNAVCERCNAILARGSRGAMAVYEGGGPTAFLCPACLGKEAGQEVGDDAE